MVLAGTHGHSQLKHQKLRMGGYTDKELKWFNYPLTRAHPGCEVSCAREYKIDCIIVLRRSQPDSRESCIMLQSGQIRSLVAKFLQHSVVTCSTQGQGRVCANL